MKTYERSIYFDDSVTGISSNVNVIDSGDEILLCATSYPSSFRITIPKSAALGLATNILEMVNARVKVAA